MGSHPINLTFRFLLELTALLAMGVWGWEQREDWLRFVLALGIPIVAALLWGIFAVPHDPSRSGKAPIPVPGVTRLLLELAIFVLATCALYASGAVALSQILGLAVAIHYVISYDRIQWLIEQ
jgi:hypothetical protein